LDSLRGKNSAGVIYPHNPYLHLGRCVGGSRGFSELPHAVSLGVMDFMLTLLLPKYSRYAGVIPNILLVLYPYIHQISRLYIFVTLANQQ
jgi:hypothetical protein